MKTSTNIPIKNKVIEIKDLQKIYELFYLTYKKSKKENKKIHAKITFDNNRNLEFENNKFEKISEFLVMKGVSKIYFELNINDYSRDYEAVAQLKIENVTDKWNNSYVYVESSDENFFLDKQHKLTSLLDSINQQSDVVEKYFSKFLILLKIFTGYLISLIIHWFVVKFNYHGSQESSQDLLSFILLKVAQSPVGNLVLNIAILYFVGTLSWASFENRLERFFCDAWPNIEFDFGPRHLEIAKKKRIAIYFVITSFIIPFLTSWLFYMMEKII